MTAITPAKSRGVGFRNGQVLLIDTDGYPAATSTSPYIGLLLDGAKQLTINDPSVRRIVHPGNDTIKAVDFLPPNEAMTADLQVSGSDFDLDAALTGLKVSTVGEAKEMLVNTNKKGYEKDIMALFYQMSLTGGRRSWRYFKMPAALIVPMMTGMDDNPEMRTYPVSPRIVETNEFGVPFTELANGATQAQLINGLSRGIPFWTAWKADGTEDEFLFHTSYPALATATIVVTIDGAVVSAGLTPSLTKLTFTVAPAVGKKVCAFYEVA